VLFFQTARVSNPLGIYDDLVNTSRELAHCLHGIQWDENRQPLSATKIAHMRNLLKQPTQKNGRPPNPATGASNNCGGRSSFTTTVATNSTIR
jgi:hypothetical protein